MAQVQRVLVSLNFSTCTGIAVVQENHDLNEKAFGFDHQSDSWNWRRRELKGSDGITIQKQAFALEKHHLVVEGGGAVGIAALLYRRVGEVRLNVVVVVSGSSVGLPLLLKVAREHGE